MRLRTRRLRPWVLLALVAALALHIALWGRPLRTTFSVTQVPRQQPNTPLEWVIERRTGSRETWRARDTNSDGVMDEFQTPNGSFARPGLRGEPRRWLLICLDGVPLAVMQSLWDRGHFREFFRPTATISTFPSDSEAALTEALQAAAGRGYEHLYFDRAENRVRGGAWVTLSGAGVPYIGVLDYDPPGWSKALVYVVTHKNYRADLGRLRAAVRKSHQPIFVAHVATSDSLFHLFPAAKVEPLLLEFEAVVRDLYLEARGELGVLLFSDHGNTETPSRATPLEDFLTQRGWRLHESIEGEHDVVVPAYGLIGFAAIYCRPAATPPLARELATLEGVDLVVYQDSQTGRAVVLRSGAQAELRWSAEGRRFWYQPAQGDPLELRQAFETLQSAGRLAADGSAADGDLFRATWLARYPDAAARIRTWAINHVQNRANILVSLRPGYFHGAGIFQRIVDFAGTHGALDAPSSLGFAMATYPLPPAVRLGELIPKGFLKGR